jgi:hypothetical protein
VSTLGLDALDFDRLMVSIRAMIRAEGEALLFAGTYEYSVHASRPGPAAPDGSATTLVDVLPVDASLPLPPITNLPLRSSTWGEAVSGVVDGQLCRVAFLDCSRAKPVVVGLQAVSVDATVDATGSVTLGSAQTPLVPLAGGGSPVARQQGLVSIIPPPGSAVVTGLVNGVPFTGTATGIPPGGSGIITGGNPDLQT